jgi:hypothetical protein
MSLTRSYAPRRRNRPLSWRNVATNHPDVKAARLSLTAAECDQVRPCPLRTRVPDMKPGGSRAEGTRPVARSSANTRGLRLQRIGTGHAISSLLGFPHAAHAGCRNAAPMSLRCPCRPYRQQKNG